MEKNSRILVLLVFAIIGCQDKDKGIKYKNKAIVIENKNENSNNIETKKDSINRLDKCDKKTATYAKHPSNGAALKIVHNICPVKGKQFGPVVEFGPCEMYILEEQQSAISIWDWENFGSLGVIDMKGLLFDLSLSPKGKKLAILGLNRLLVYNLKKNKNVCEYKIKDTIGAAFSKKSKLIAVAQDHQHFDWIKAEDCSKYKSTVKIRNRINMVGINSFQDGIVVKTNKGNLLYFKDGNKRKTQRFRPLRLSNNYTISKKGTIIGSYGIDKRKQKLFTLRVVDKEGRKISRDFKADRRYVDIDGIELFSDNKTILVLENVEMPSKDSNKDSPNRPWGRLRIWNYRTGKNIATLEHKEKILVAWVTPNDRYIIARTGDVDSCYRVIKVEWK